MLMAVNEPYALMVQPDDILISPREVDEHFWDDGMLPSPAMRWATITTIWTKMTSCGKCI